MNILALAACLAIGTLIGALAIWLALRNQKTAAVASAHLESAQQLATLEQAKAGLIQEKGWMEGEAAKLNAALQAAESRLITTQTAMEDVRKAKSGLESRIAELIAEAQARTESLRTTEARLAETHAERQTLSQEATRLKTEVARLSADAEARTARIADLEGRLGNAQTTVSETQAALDEAREAKAHLDTRLAKLETEGVARETAFEEARTQLQESFRAQAAQALQSNNEAFLTLAQTALQQTQVGAQGDLDARHTAIANLLEPLKQSLTAMDQQVNALKQAQSEGDTKLSTRLEDLAKSQQQLQGETGRLANALRKPQVRGRWGELQLQNLVELSGMQEHVDFETQSSMEVDDQRRRPDMLIKLPGDKCVAVDAKTPMATYLDALEAATEEDREARLKDLPRHIRTHIDQLANRNYFGGLEQSPDFVVLFLHGEGVFALACEHDSHLIEYGMKQNVLLATPMTLMALLKSAAYGWQQQKIQANAEEIRSTAAELIKRFATMTEHIENIGSGLSKAVGSYNKFAGSLERSVIPQARRIQALGVTAYTARGEAIEFPETAQLEAEPREINPALLAPFQDTSSLATDATN